MNAYPGFPPCRDNETSSRDRDHSKAAHSQQFQAYPGRSTFLQKCREGALRTHSSIFIEYTLSPAKYALFQLFGTAFLQICCPRAPASYAISAKIGAFGGIVIATFYLFLALARGATTKPEPQNDEPTSPRQSAMILLHEMTYSAIASVIGCMAYSRTGPDCIDFALQTLSGSLGPILFLLMLFSSVGVVWLIIHIHKRAANLYTGN